MTTKHGSESGTVSPDQPNADRSPEPVLTTAAKPPASLRTRLIRRCRRLAAKLIRRGRRWLAPVVRAFRSSLQLRVVTATLVASTVLVVMFGFVVAKSITDGLVADRRSSGIDEVRQARADVSEALAEYRFTGDARLDSAMETTINELVTESSTETTPTVLLRSRTAPDLEAARPKGPDRITLPADLQQLVAEGKLGTQYFLTNPDDHGTRPFLVVGTLVHSGQDYELYYLFPLDSVEDSVALVRTTLIVAGLALVLLLGVLSAMVTRLVVSPVRDAARTAQRLSAGLLHERMKVRGADDLARLAGSFNLMAENLQQQITRLEEMSRLQRRFTSDVSHELRTPLTTVRMAADLLHDSRDDFPPAAARSAELLYNELDRFEELLGELLEISRFDAGFAALDTEAVDLGPIVAAVAESFATLAESCGVELRLHLPSEPIVAEIDARRVQRILRNLVGNAIEHAEGKPVCVTMAESGTSVAVVVRDRGVGLKAGEEKLVFNRFWRADPSRARQTGGTGLGLSISVEDAKLHGGRLEATGTPGAGSVFRLTLPLRSGNRVVASPLPMDPDMHCECGADDD